VDRHSPPAAGKECVVKPRRALFVIVIVVLLVAAVLVGNARASKPAPATQPASASTLDGGDVWFCPGLPPSLPAGDGRVTFANTGTTPADIAITVLADKTARAHQVLTVAPNSVVTKHRTDVGPAGALTIETFGGRVAIEEGLDGESGFESSPCATRTSATWEFAAGTTPRGVEQWLVLENPYASDAKVDVTLRTNDGVRRPESLQGMDVTRRSRVVVPIHDLAVRVDHVAVEVTARLGEVVAAQTLVYTADAGTPGVATTLGATDASDHWTFAEGANLSDTESWVALANVGGADTSVTLQVIGEKNLQLRPTIVPLPQDAVLWVQLGNCGPKSGPCANVPDGARYALDVRSDEGAKVVAQELERLHDSPAGSGATTSLGFTSAAARWVFARSRADVPHGTGLAFLNSLAQSVTVKVTLVHDGLVSHPSELQHLTIGGGRRSSVSIRLSNKSVPIAAIVVEASAPIAVERQMAGVSDVSRSVGVVVG
jgi:hypothetical protein